MERDSVPSMTTASRGRPVSQAIATRRASLSHILSRSAPDSDTLTLPNLTPLRSTSGSSLPESPSCSVGTQTPSDSLHFVFPDTSDFLDVDDEDVPDYKNKELGVEISGRGFISNDMKLVDRCFRRLSFHSGIVHGGGIQQRTFAQDFVQKSSSPVEDSKLKMNGIQDVGQQLRSIGDQFEQSRSQLTRSRSLSFLQLFAQGPRRGSVP